MNHINEDKLLEYALEVLPDRAESDVIERHLESCPDCAAILEKIRGDLELLGSIRPNHPVLKIPFRRARIRFVYSLIKAAALLILGMAAGYGISNWINEEPAVVSQAYLRLSPPPDSTLGFAAADATEISSNAYGDIISKSD